MVKLKDKVEEFAIIAAALPENLQSICFELLLKNHLETHSAHKPKIPDTPVVDPKIVGSQNEQEPKAESQPDSQDDLAEKDLHVKARKLLEKNALSIDHLNNLFYKENDKVLPLYDDLKTTQMAESQIRVTLLLALHKGMQTGDFEAQVEEVRRGCIDRKCYDKRNFASIFTKRSTLFDFDKYSKEITNIKLSTEGQKELADVIRELQ